LPYSFYVSSQAREVIKRVSPRDEMFNRELGRYMRVGADAIRCIRLFMSADEQVSRILDFGCGHGRVLRFLAAEFPNAELTACDVDEDGVRFCCETFGAKGVVSAPDPAEVSIPGPFDLIWSGSVFTNLALEPWKGFLRLLGSLLTEEGLLVLTVTGSYLAESMEEKRKHDQAFRRRRDVARMLAQYHESGFAGKGRVLVKPEWVIAQIESSGLRALGYHERGWVERQDVVGARRRLDAGRP
jgi:SAM-dependent methyltransferase